MPISIRTNVPSLSAQRNLTRTQHAVNETLQRLSSGYRINVAKDDPAGLAISENLKAQIRGIRQASRNANDAISMIQVAEGSLAEISTILIRLRELAVQAASDSVGDTERGFLMNEFESLRDEIDRISTVTEFNRIHLIDGSVSVGLEFQVGIRNTLDDRITVAISNAGPESIGTATENLSSVSISSKDGARDALDVIDDAIMDISSIRAELGAAQSRLTLTVDNLSFAYENISAANSRIRDADIAVETANLTREQILLQAGASVLAQANAAPQIALALIGGV
jgi:flagellin